MWNLYKHEKGYTRVALTLLRGKSHQICKCHEIALPQSKMEPRHVSSRRAMAVEAETAALDHSCL